jgi:hypothetical protein
MRNPYRKRPGRPCPAGMSIDTRIQEIRDRYKKIMKETLRLHNCLYRGNDGSLLFRVSFYIGSIEIFREITVLSADWVTRQRADPVFAYNLEVALRRKYSAGIKPPYPLRNFLIERL